MAKVKGITFELPIVDRSFVFTEKQTRVELAIDFILTFWDVVREYSSDFSTRFLREMLQTPSSFSTLSLPLVSQRFVRLISDNVSEISVTAFSTIPNTFGDRKVKEIIIEYDYIDSEIVDKNAITPSVFARFIEQ